MTPNEFFLYGISRIDLVAHSNASGEVARSSAAMGDGEGADPVDEWFAGWIAEGERGNVETPRSVRRPFKN